MFEETPAVATDPAHSRSEIRMRAVGRCTSGRFVFVVFTIRMRLGEHLIHPISARYLHPKEMRRYEEAGS